MFRQVECTEELALHFGRREPPFFHAIKFEAEGRLPLTKLSLYSYTTDNAVYWYGYKVNELVKNHVIFTSEGEFHKDHFLEGFRKFDSVVGLTSMKKLTLFTANETYNDTALKAFDDSKFEWQKFPTHNYFVSKEQEKLVLDAKVPELPEGYELGSASGDDAEVITKTWIRAGPGDKEQTRQKVTCFPSSCIRFHGEPVAFEMVDVPGIFNHQFVMEEHRRKGLGNVVELDLMKKCIGEGFAVYKNVGTYNTRVIEASDRSPYWTKVVDEEGAPVIRGYLNIWPKESQ